MAVLTIMHRCCYAVLQGSMSSPTGSPAKGAAASTPSVPNVLTDPSDLHDSEGFRVSSGADITDYSPDWAYTEGGVKVLITGPWFETNR